MAYSLFHACPNAEEPVVPENATTVNCLSADPLFVAAEEGDLRLSSNSPALDMGKASTSVCEEAEPNGCAPNLGAFGGTEASTPSGSGVHCPCDLAEICPQGALCSDGDPCTDDLCQGGECVGTNNGTCP